MTNVRGIVGIGVGGGERTFGARSVPLIAMMLVATGWLPTSHAWAAGSQSTAGAPIDVAAFPETSTQSTSFGAEASRVQLAGSGPRAWVTWCDDQGSWAQRGDLAATQPPILLPAAVDACPLEAYTSPSGAMIVVFWESGNNEDWLRTVRVTSHGATTVDRVAVPQLVDLDPAVAASSAGVVVVYRFKPAEGFGADLPLIVVTADRSGHVVVAKLLSDSGPPAVAIDPRGRTVVCWQEFGPEDEDKTSPTPTRCRVREPGATEFDPPTTAWNARGLGVTSQNADEPWLVDLQSHSIALADDGAIGLLGAGDGAVGNVLRAGTWGLPAVQANVPTDYNQFENAATFDAAGTLHSAWVANPKGKGDRTLEASSLSADGASSTARLDVLRAGGYLSTVMVPTPDGGTALLWAGGRRHGGPLRMATTAPGKTAFAAPVNRDPELSRLTLDMDASPAPDQSWVAELQHFVDGKGHDTGTAAIRLMPVVPGGDATSHAAKSRARAANTLGVSIAKPVVTRATVSARLVCRDAHGRCSGYVNLDVRGRTPVRRQFTVGRSGTARMRFSGASTRRLLRERPITLVASVRSRDGRVAAACRSTGRDARATGCGR